MAAANHCRSRRVELSLLVMEPNLTRVNSNPDPQLAIHARRALGIACAALDEDKLTLISLTELRTVAIISDCERRTALAVAKNAIEQYAKAIELNSEAHGGAPTALSVGVATASVVPKNFEPARMIERAIRCLSAARSCGISTVKSIEV